METGTNSTGFVCRATNAQCEAKKKAGQEKIETTHKIMEV